MKFIKYAKVIFFFLVTISGIIGVNTLKGDVVFSLGEMRIELPIPFFVIGLIIFGIVLLLLRAIWNVIWLLPEKYQRFLEKKRLNKSQNLLLESFAALDAVQPQEAQEAAHLAYHLTPQNPVVLYVAAKSAIAAGKIEKAKNYLELMLKEPRLKFLGLCGLIQIAQNEKNYEKSSLLIQDALRLRHDSPWLIQILQKNTLKLLQKGVPESMIATNVHKFLDREQRDYYMALQLYVRAQKQQNALSSVDEVKGLLKKSLEVFPAFLPSAIALSTLCIKDEYDYKIFKLLLKVVGIKPHPTLLNNLLLIGKYETPTVAYQFFCEKLTLDDYENVLFLARLAANASLLDAAKQLIEKAIQIHPTIRAYEQAMHILSAKGMSFDLNLYEKLKPDYSWNCSSCFHQADAYHVFCPHCDAMDTLNYAYIDHTAKMNVQTKDPFLMAG